MLEEDSLKERLFEDGTPIPKDEERYGDPIYKNVCLTLTAH